MPWRAATVSETRTAFVHAVRTAHEPVAAACRRFAVSRKTAYKWLARFDAGEPLEDRSRAPNRSPRRTDDELERAVLGVRDEFGWGPRKIVAYLRNRSRPAPPIRTAAAILRRHARVGSPAPVGPAPECQRFERSEPNQLWQLDFKGYSEVARRKVFPLTVLDDHSRFLLALRCCPDQTLAGAWDVLWDVFGEYGLPDAVLCDNAFGTLGPRAPGVSWFDARLLRVGVRPIHGRAYHPQTQGKVERLHGTLEREVYPRVSRDTVGDFQAGLDAWRRGVYNATRPHQGIGDVPPVTRWSPSRRRRPGAPPPVEYPSGSVVRRVASSGDIRWRGAKILVGQGAVGQDVRVEEAGGCVVVWYGTHKLRELPLDDFPSRDRL
jgi:transposase InsO family protein